jgi:putative solute:sodium symporter small subunit
MTSPLPDSTKHQLYWIRTRRLTIALLLVWFFSTFGIIFFARELSAISFFGWPFSFYLAAQGAVILYTVIIAVYTYKMDKLDQIFEMRDDVQ